MWSEERGAENGVVPIENDARLANFRFVLLSEPDLVVSQSREELVSNLLVRP